VLQQTTGRLTARSSNGRIERSNNCTTAIDCHHNGVHRSRRRAVRKRTVNEHPEQMTANGHARSIITSTVVAGCMRDAQYYIKMSIELSSLAKANA